MKPIRIFYSTLSGRFYASAHYKVESKAAGGQSDIVVITGQKFDVTDQIGALIEEHQVEFSRAEQKTEHWGQRR